MCSTLVEALPSDASGWRLIDDRPEDAQFLDGVHEFVEIDRLDDTADRTLRIALAFRVTTRAA
jgi:hypothetical protein